MSRTLGFFVGCVVLTLGCGDDGGIAGSQTDGATGSSSSGEATTAVTTEGTSSTAASASATTGVTSEGETTSLEATSAGASTGASSSGDDASGPGSSGSGSSGSGSTSTGAEVWEPVVFSVMGDVPYTAAEYGVLAQQVADHNTDSPSEFMVHVGDIKPGDLLCPESIYQNVAAILHGLAAPTFVLPGDNEWNDCLDNGAAWNNWMTHFSRFEEAWPAAPTVERQAVRDENFAWSSDGVVFVGINLVGGFVHDLAEWTLRLGQDGEWVRDQLEAHPEAYAAVIFAHANPAASHASYVSAMEAAAMDFGRPVLFVHGDGHSWIDDVPFAATNIRRIQVEAGGAAVPLQVTVDAEAVEVFTLERMPF